MYESIMHCLITQNKALKKLIGEWRVNLFLYFYVTRYFIAAFTKACTEKAVVLVTCTERKPVGISAEAPAIMTQILCHFLQALQVEIGIELIIGYGHFHVHSNIFTCHPSSHQRYKILTALQILTLKKNQGSSLECRICLTHPVHTLTTYLFQYYLSM